MSIALRLLAILRIAGQNDSGLRDFGLMMATIALAVIIALNPRLTIVPYARRMNQPNASADKIRIALVVIRNKEGEYGLHFRDGNPGISNPLQWSLFGGHAEPGETTLQTARRELAEEIDVDVAEADLEHVGTLKLGNALQEIVDCRRSIEWSDIRLREGAGCGFFTDRELARLHNCSPLVDWLRNRIGVVLENSVTGPAAAGRPRAYESRAAARQILLLGHLRWRN